MTTVLLVIHLFVTVALIIVVLLQRSEGGGLGIGSGGGGMGSFMSGRGTANLLTRATAVLGTIFFVLSLTLAILNQGSRAPRSLLDSMPAGPAGTVAPTPAPAPAPSGPQVPVN